MVDRIADFRDANDLHRLNGAEDPDYAAAEMPWDAKDAPFEALEELQQVLGMTAEIYERVVPALTLYAGARAPHEPTAPPEVTAFYGTRDLLRARREAEGTPQPEEPRDEAADPAAGPVALEAEGPAPTRSGVPVFTIHAEARLPDGTLFAREAIVRLSGDRRAPYHILSLKQGWRALFSTEADETQQDDGG